jgi:hypothetical protein
VLAFVTCAVALQALMFAAVRRSRLSVLPTAQAPRVGTVIRPSYGPGRRSPGAPDRSHGYGCAPSLSIETVSR